MVVRQLCNTTHSVSSADDDDDDDVLKQVGRFGSVMLIHIRVKYKNYLVMLQLITSNSTDITASCDT